MYLNGACISFDVYHIPHCDLFFKNRFIDGRIQPKLFCPSDRLQAHHDVGYRFPISTERVLSFSRCQLGHLAFVNFFGLLYPQTCEKKEYVSEESEIADRMWKDVALCGID